MHLLCKGVIMGIGIGIGGGGGGDGGSPYSGDLFPTLDDTFQIGRVNLRWNNGRFSQDMEIDGNVCVGVPIGLGLSRYHSRRGGSGVALTASALQNATRPIDLIIENLEHGSGTRFILASHLSGGATNEIEFWGNDLNLDYAHAASIVSSNVIGSAAGKIRGAIGFHTANDETEPSERMRLKSAGELVIGAVGSDGSALLEVTSTTRGFLPPRMTLAQQNAITAPASGLQIYNTTGEHPSVYDGTDWRPFALLDSSGDLAVVGDLTVQGGQIKITGGAPGVGKVLTSDVDGLASWEEISAADVKSGMEAAIADDSTRVVVFASAFVSIPNVVVSQNSTEQQHILQVESVSTAGFTINIVKNHPSSDDTVDVSWIATDVGNAA